MFKWLGGLVDSNFVPELMSLRHDLTPVAHLMSYYPKPLLLCVKPPSGL